LLGLARLFGLDGCQDDIYPDEAKEKARDGNYQNDSLNSPHLYQEATIFHKDTSLISKPPSVDSPTRLES
jgi:hypothetical protein